MSAPDFEMNPCRADIGAGLRAGVAKVSLGTWSSELTSPFVGGSLKLGVRSGMESLLLLEKEVFSCWTWALENGSRDS